MTELELTGTCLPISRDPMAAGGWELPFRSRVPVPPATLDRKGNSRPKLTRARCFDTHPQPDPANWETRPRCVLTECVLTQLALVGRCADGLE